jgi:alpha-tubulin suppressor-like RCC1 family protein
MAKDVTRFDANGPLICWIGNGLARCEPNVQIWSDDGVSSGTPLVAIKDPSLVQIATGWAHACVRRKNGTVGCWGHNHGGQLGAGPIDKTPREALVTVKLAPAIDIAARENTTCAVVRGGGVWCWGYNRDGQVGNGTSGNVYTVGAPVEAP